MTRNANEPIPINPISRHRVAEQYAAEIEATPETGKYVWRPGDNTIIPEWTVGIHTVWVRWDRISGLPDPGEWRWSFRVQ